MFFAGLHMKRYQSHGQNSTAIGTKKQLIFSGMRKRTGKRGSNNIGQIEYNWGSLHFIVNNLYNRQMNECCGLRPP